MRILGLLLAGVALALAGCTDSTMPEAAAAQGAAARSATTPKIPPATDAPAVPDTPDLPAAAPPADDAPATGRIVLDPEVLDAGQVATYERGTATVELVNDGTVPVKLVMCKSTCGCAAAACPEGRIIQPGKRLPVVIRVNSDTRPLRFEKEITFGFENAPPAKLLVKAETVSYVNAEPWDLVPGAPLTLRSTDGTPFGITRVAPDVLAELPAEPAAVHVLAIDWGRWRTLGSPRKIVFFTDHPKCKQVLTMVDAPPPE